MSNFCSNLKNHVTEELFKISVSRHGRRQLMKIIQILIPDLYHRQLQLKIPINDNLFQELLLEHTPVNKYFQLYSEMKKANLKYQAYLSKKANISKGKLLKMKNITFGLSCIQQEKIKQYIKLNNKQGFDFQNNEIIWSRKMLTQGSINKIKEIINKIRKRKATKNKRRNGNTNSLYISSSSPSTSSIIY